MIIISNFWKKKEKNLFLKKFIFKKIKNLKLNMITLLNIINLLFYINKNKIILNFLKKYYQKYNYINILNYFNNFSLFYKNILYIVLNNKKKQVFLNILNSSKKNKNFLSTGVCLKYLNIKTKSMRRSNKGFLILINFLKKILLKNKFFFFNFFVNSSKKYSLILFKELSFFLKNIKKKNSAIIWQIKLSSGNNLKKIRRIKRRLKKRILKHEAGTNF